jgi:ribosomal protein L11 methyltransferase
VRAQTHDLRSQPLPCAAPLVLANLLRPLLLDLLGAFAHTPAHVIASGLLREEADEIAAAYGERLNLRERARRERGEWAALWLASR